MITILLSVYGKERKFNYKMIPFSLGSKLSKYHLYHLTGSVMNQIKFQQSIGALIRNILKCSTRMTTIILIMTFQAANWQRSGDAVPNHKQGH